MAKVVEHERLTSKQIVEMNKEYTFFSWSVQGQIDPIPVVRAEGVYFWDASGKRYLDATDDTFADAGKIGLWTKADAQTNFTALRAEEK